MAAKKKAKAKGKKVKKKASKTAARKKLTRRPAKKKVRGKGVKSKGRKPKTAAKTSRMPVMAPKPAAPVAPVGGIRIGTVTHYFTHLGVAIVQLETGSLREGDMVHVRGHTSDFSQRVESMELDHAHVGEAHAGQSIGLRVKEHAREHDVVYKVA
jgi:hypothetical protein